MDESPQTFSAKEVSCIFFMCTKKKFLFLNFPLVPHTAFFLRCNSVYPLTLSCFVTDISSMIRQKGESQKGCYKKTNRAKFSEKRTSRTP